MKSYSFTVMGDPKGQPRQRHFARKIGNKFVARSYDPGTAEGWKSLIAIAAKQAGLAGAMLQGPILLQMRCFFARPKSHYRTGKNGRLLKDNAPSRHTSKPDLDNILKAAKDALTQCGAWRDDSQVCYEIGKKRYVYPKEAAYTEFYIEEVAA